MSSLFDIIFRSHKNKASSLFMTTQHDLEKDFVLSERLDTKQMREVWNNTSKPYKLGASVIIAGISALIDYTGVPYLSNDKKQDIKLIQKHFGVLANTIHRKCFTEGNFFIWVNWNDKLKDLEFILFNYENMWNPVFDIDTGELIEVSFKHNFHYNDKSGNHCTANRIMRFTDKEIITTYDGNRPQGMPIKSVKKHSNGRLPLVFVRYNRSLDEVYGHGYIEAAEPYIRGLSSIMENRLIEDKRSSRKKLKITAKNPESFLLNTASVNGLVNENGEQIRSLDIEDMDIIFCAISENNVAENAEWLKPDQTAQDSLQIGSHMIQCIKEVLGTPDWVYPAKLGASYASVSAQVPSWIHHIENIRTRELTNIWQQLYDLCATILSNATGRRIVDTDVKWKRLDLETPELRAKIVNYMISSMKLARENLLMTDEEIRDYLDEYMNDLGSFTSLESELPKMLENLKKKSDAIKGSEEEEPRDQSDRDRPSEGENLNSNELRDKTSE